MLNLRNILQLVIHSLNDSPLPEKLDIRTKILKKILNSSVSSVSSVEDIERKFP